MPITVFHAFQSHSPTVYLILTVYLINPCYNMALKLVISRNFEVRTRFSLISCCVCRHCVDSGESHGQWALAYHLNKFFALKRKQLERYDYLNSHELYSRTQSRF